MPEFLQSLFGSSPRAAAVFYGVAGALAAVALVVLWQVFGRGPRSRRGLKRARRRLAEGAWQDALERVRKLRNAGSSSPAWKKRFNEAEAECLRAAAQAALADKKFEDALHRLLRVAQVLGEPEVGPKITIQASMLEEVRRLFSVTTMGDNQPVHELIARTLLVQSPCREASFWQGMCFLRGGELDRAAQALQTARTGEAKTLMLDDGLGELANPNPVATPTSSYIDPPLYLGALLLRQGQAKDSLKHLTEANRAGGNCPVVTLQLGAAMIAAGGDTQLAVRALQRALGPRGLGMWAPEPRKAWVEGFPEGRSYVRKLAAAYPFVCPLWGGDLNVLTQQGNLALAQGLYKMAAYAEAADLFGKVLQNGAPSLVVLRGLGLSLARLGKYDDAFKHLRIAHEMEEPKERVTAGYLALCGAKGKPTQPEDKARNIRWALQVVTRFNAPGDREWVALIGALFAEAREEKVELSLDDQLYLCEHLWSVQEADPQAAQAYHHLQATYPQAVHKEYAWLYCRAAQQHRALGEHSLALFARTFADPQAARAFFAEKQWAFDEVEFTYLERAAALDPGHFPAALGPEYPSVGEDLLLTRSRKQEQAGQLDAALATAEILQKLAPQSPQALDRLAYLCHRRGNPDRSVDLLESWFTQHPHDPRPVVRFAILLHQRGLLGECQTKLREALNLCDAKLRPRVAFLGARLTLQNALAQAAPESNGATALDGAALKAAEDFLGRCLADDPHHADALWCLAAVRWLRGDLAGLAQQAAAMTRPEVADVRFQFFAALCRLAAQDCPGVLETCARIGNVHPATPRAAQKNGATPGPRLIWPLETAYLAGLAHLDLGQNAAAAEALEKAAVIRESPSAAHAQALLGAIGFLENNHEEASKWWQTLEPKKRVAWKLGETLAHTVFLTALEAYTRGQFEEAAEKLRAAGKLGCRDRRLGALLVMSLFRAGQALVYGKTQ
jgi:hypothetical protein